MIASYSASELFARLSKMDATVEGGMQSDAGAEGDADSPAPSDIAPETAAEGDTSDDVPGLPRPVFEAGVFLLQLQEPFGEQVIDDLAYMLADPRKTAASPEAVAQFARPSNSSADEDTLIESIAALPDREREQVVRVLLWQMSDFFQVMYCLSIAIWRLFATQ